MERDRFDRKEGFLVKFESPSLRFTMEDFSSVQSFVEIPGVQRRNLYGVIRISRTMPSSRQVLEVIGNLWRPSTQLERALSRSLTHTCTCFQFVQKSKGMIFISYLKPNPRTSRACPPVTSSIYTTP